MRKILSTIIFSPLRTAGKFVKKHIKSIAFISLGTVFIILGMAGAVLPLLPGVPFILIGISLYIRTTGKFLKIIEKTPLKNQLEKKIETKTKLYAILPMWIPLFISLAFLDLSDKKQLIIFSASSIVPILLSIYIIKVKTIGEILGIEPNREKWEEKSKKDKVNKKR